MLIIEAIRQLLETGQFQKARETVEGELKQRPENERLREIWEVLKPSEVARVESCPEMRKRIAADHQWLKDNAARYSDQWVALDGGDLVGNADTFQELYNTVDNLQDGGYLVTAVKGSEGVNDID